MRCTLLLLLTTAVTGAVLAQEASLSGPIEGFTFDLPTASLRAVIGYPGSASFGPALLEGLDYGSVAPQKDYAIVFQGGNCLLVSHLGSGPLSPAPISSVAGQPDGITWSGDGSFAVLYSRGGNWIQTLSGLPLNPTAGAYVDVSSLGGSLSAVAIDAKGTQVAIAITGNVAGVYLMRESQAFSSLLQLSNPIAVAFSTDGNTLFALDAATQQLSVLDLNSSACQTLTLDGLADPFAVGAPTAQQNRQMVYVASRSDQLLREYDVSSQQVVLDLPLYFAPTGIEEFGRNSFRVAARLHATDPLWLLTNSAPPAVYFVPAVQPDPGPGGQQ